MAAVTLREITPDNRAAVEALAVTDEPTRYVAGVVHDGEPVLELDLHAT